MNPASGTQSTIGAVPVDAVPPDPGTGVLQRRRRERLKTLPLVVASNTIDGAFLMGFSGLGVIAWHVSVGLLALASSFYLMFFIILRTQLPERLRDHHMVIEQLTIGSFYFGVAMIAAPEVSALLMMMPFVSFSFAALRLKTRAVFLGSLVLGLYTAAIVVMLGDSIALPAADGAQRALSGLWYLVTLAKVSFLGRHGAALRSMLNEQRVKLSDALAQVERLANHDELTGAMNRRAIMALLSDEQARLRRTGTPYAVALFDIDLFKQVNDRYGHLIGDVVLRRFSQQVAGAVRETDRLARFGGEEFLVLMPCTGNEDAVAAATRVREAVASVDWGTAAPGLAVTASAGVAVARTDETVEALLDRADKALYEAKNAGRNCIRSR